MKRILLLAGLFISSTLFAQTKEEIGTKLSIVEALPQFPGGYDAFGKYISKSLNYPEIARIIGIDGKVIISFVIDKNGRLVDIEPKSCLGAGCEAEAQRILENSPIWKPGFQDGKAVRVQHTLPISFNNPKPKFTIDELKKSTFNFVFLLKDKEYSLTDCEALKIKKFKSEWVETSMLHPEQNKFTDSEKRETYILKIKDTSYDEFFANNSSL